MNGVFDKYERQIWPYRFRAVLLVHDIRGGIPSDSKKAEGWLRSKIEDKDEAIMRLVAQTMAERGIEYDQAIVEANETKNLNGFKRDPELGLYIEGRYVKAAIKEAASIALNEGKLKANWGKTNKGLLKWLPEHVFVEEKIIPLGCTEADGIVPGFVHVWRGSSIKLEEYVTEAKLTLHVVTDHKFSDEEWRTIWLYGQKQGLGASKSQGCGTYKVVEWERDS